MYKVKVLFTDLQDGNYKYMAGTEYPRKGYSPSAERIAELASDKNKRGIPLIEEIPEINQKTPDLEELTVSTDEIPVETVKPKKGRKKQNKE